MPGTLSLLRQNAAVMAPLLGKALPTAALAAVEIRSLALRGFRIARLARRSRAVAA
jgi:hypothetical protein